MPDVKDKEFKALYLGKVVVNTKEGPDVIQASVKRMKAQGKQPYEVTAAITFEKLTITDRVTNELVQTCAMTEVSFSCIDKGDKKVTFGVHHTSSTLCGMCMFVDSRAASSRVVVFEMTGDAFSSCRLQWFHWRNQCACMCASSAVCRSWVSSQWTNMISCCAMH